MDASIFTWEYVHVYIKARLLVIYWTNKKLKCFSNNSVIYVFHYDRKNGVFFLKTFVRQNSYRNSHGFSLDDNILINKQWWWVAKASNIYN